MSDETFLKEETLKEGESFSIKGKPSINLTRTDTQERNQLKFILQQKIEEIQEDKKNRPQIVAATKDAEFSPEATPFIPDVQHTVLLKHKHSTMERVAGYQDASLVSPMYAKQIEEKKRIEKELAEQSVDVLSTNEEPVQKKSDPEVPLYTENEFETNIDKIFCVIETIVNPAEKKVENNPAQPKRGKEADFTMKVPRERMHAGGVYMKNEYRPYRPGG